MRKNFWYLGFIIGLFFFQSCSSDSAFKESQALNSNLIWRNDKPVYFNIPELTFEEGTVDSTLVLELLIRYAYHIPNGVLPVKIVVLKDDVPVQNIDYTCLLKDEKGNIKGEALGDIVDLSLEVPEKIKYLGKGTRLKIAPMVEERGFAGVMEIGVALKFVK